MPDEEMDRPSTPGFWDMIREAVTTSADAFQESKQSQEPIVDGVESPAQLSAFENLLRSHPEIVACHHHLLMSAIGDQPDKDVREYLQDILSIVSGSRESDLDDTASELQGHRSEPQPSVSRWKFSGEMSRSSSSRSSRSSSPGEKLRYLTPSLQYPSPSVPAFSDSGLARAICIECDDPTVPAHELDILECRHRICQRCLKRKFRLSVAIPISRNMPPRCCTEDSIPAVLAEGLFDASFWKIWTTTLAKWEDRNLVYMRCPHASCSGIIGLDATSPKDNIVCSFCNGKASYRPGRLIRGVGSTKIQNIQSREPYIPYVA